MNGWSLIKTGMIWHFSFSFHENKVSYFNHNKSITNQCHSNMFNTYNRTIKDISFTINLLQDVKNNSVRTNNLKLNYNDGMTYI